MNKKIKICFIGNQSSSFVKRDYTILKKHFDVIPFNHKKNCLKLIFGFFELAKNVRRSDLSFSWFAGWHSAFGVFFSKLFRKQSVVVIGGHDAVCIPEINYGAFTNLEQRIPAKYSIKNASIVIAVSEFTKKKALEQVKPKQIKVVYNGVDIEKFKPSHEKKEEIIVTIAAATKKFSRLKGLVTFAKASIYFSNYKFVIIGATDNTTVDELKKINKKLIFTGLIEHEEVIKWLQNAKVYCQLSYIESFGLGNAEAMSCNCVPVVTDNNALSEVVGDTGFYVPYGDEKVTAETIKKALDAPYELGQKARERIINNFPIELRERKLVEIISNLVSR